MALGLPHSLETTLEPAQIACKAFLFEFHQQAIYVGAVWYS
jgi:hypothetical protein